MASLRVEIVSAEKEIWSGEASLVSAPFITRIKPGEIRVKPSDDSAALDIYVSGGLLEVQPTAVTILADDEAAAQKAKDEAEAALAGSTPGEIDFEAVQTQLAEAAAQLQFVKKLRRQT